MGPQRCQPPTKLQKFGHDTPLVGSPWTSQRLPHRPASPKARKPNPWGRNCAWAAGKRPQQTSRGGSSTPQCLKQTKHFKKKLLKTPMPFLIQSKTRLSERALENTHEPREKHSGYGSSYSSKVRIGRQVHLPYTPKQSSVHSGGWFL